jgi:CelD/BcsL family acetyltransferase involved in cellulose biosynthesis
VEDGSSVIGVAPLFAQRSRGGLVSYRFLTSPISKYLEPLSAEDREPEVAQAIADALSRLTPQPDLLVFDGVPVESRWPALLREYWPASTTPWERNAYLTASPVISLPGSSYEQWWQSRSGRWRREMSRRRRHLNDHAIEFQLHHGSDASPAVHEFVDLHNQRWTGRGGSDVLSDGVDRMLVDAAARLADSNRFRLWTMETDGRSVSSHLFLAAGGEVTYWLGGFDSKWAWCSPAMQVILEALQHAWTTGDERFNLGPGGQSYKYRFADDEELLHWSQIAPHGRRYPLTRLALVPSQVRERLSSRLPDDARERVRRAISRLKVW